MKSMRIQAVLAAFALLSLAGVARASGTEVAVLGGFQVLNKNDTALPDRIVNVPAVASVSYHVTPIVAVEGELTWLIPVQQSVELGSGQSQDRKTPHALAYQANLRANWPVSPAWSPYVTGGAGALTLLSQNDPNRLPQIDESQTMFAVNFGAGVNYDLDGRWGVRADFREFVAFPADDAPGLSDPSGADPIWMERGTVGLTYRF